MEKNEKEAKAMALIMKHRREIDEQNPLKKLTKRLERIGVDIELTGNVPWIYLSKVNGNKVMEKNLSNHRFTIAFVENNRINLVDTDKMFEIIRKYK